MKKVIDFPGTVYTIDRPTTEADRTAMQKFIRNYDKLRRKVKKTVKSKA